MTVADRLKSLRKSLNLTQQQFADAAGIDRITVAHVETSVNKASAYHLRASLARAAGFAIEDFSAYIDGELPLERLLARATRADHRMQAAELARADGVYERAIQAVMDEPMTPDLVSRSALWWAMRMKLREAELVERSSDQRTRFGTKVKT